MITEKNHKLLTSQLFVTDCTKKGLASMNRSWLCAYVTSSQIMKLVFAVLPKHATLKGKNKTDWLEIMIMCPSGAKCISTDCCKIVGLVHRLLLDCWSSTQTVVRLLVYYTDCCKIVGLVHRLLLDCWSSTQTVVRLLV